jgi:hypothetical protein
VLFTCPSRYSSTIGHTGVFSLGGWSPQLRARFLVPGATQEFRYDVISCSATGLSPSLASRSREVHLTCHAASAAPTTPIPQGDRFGLGPFRSPLLRTSRLISLPPGTEMFQFPGFASFRRRMTGFRQPGCPIRPSRDHRVCATPPSFSQLTTAFIASVCPGIPHMPSFA